MMTLAKKRDSAELSHSQIKISSLKLIAILEDNFFAII